MRLNGEATEFAPPGTSVRFHSPMQVANKQPKNPIYPLEKKLGSAALATSVRFH